jgi:hypothetical protein
MSRRRYADLDSPLYLLRVLGLLTKLAIVLAASAMVIAAWACWLPFGLLLAAVGWLNRRRTDLAWTMASSLNLFRWFDRVR